MMAPSPVGRAEVLVIQSPEEGAKLFLFRTDSLELFCNGVAVAIEERSLEVLQFLLKAPGTFHKTDEIHRSVWGGRSSTDPNNVAQQIKRLRHVLGQKCIENPKKGEGYRFAGVIREASPEEVASITASPHPNSSTRVVDPLICPYTGSQPFTEQQLIYSSDDLLKAQKW